MITENDIIEILNDDKNYKEIRIPTEEALANMRVVEVFKELDYDLVAKSILDKIKEGEK